MSTKHSKIEWSWENLIGEKNKWYSLNEILQLIENYFVNSMKNKNSLKGVYYTECTDVYFNKSQNSKMRNENEYKILNFYDRNFCQNKLPNGIKQYIIKYINKKHPKITKMKVIIQQMVATRVQNRSESMVSEY